MEFTQKSRTLRALRDEPGRVAETWLRRATGQLEFATAFQSVLPPSETRGWDEQVAQARARLAAYDAKDGLEALARTVQDAEADMAAIGEAAKGYRIHCVGHGHVDMNWMWSWPETVATTHDTFASVLALMDQYPDLTYSQSQASVYAIIERYHPRMFAQIQERVREGRWEITAAHWVEGDKNLSSAESICRHLLYARDYFQTRFGLAPEDLPVDWEPDTFGHAATIPSIIAQGAVKYYYSCRQGGGFDHARVGEPRPPMFYWQGPDGARVLVNRETTWYNSYTNISENIALPLVNFVKETRLHQWLNVFGIGNHGGGPTRAEIDYYHELQQWPVYPEIVFSTSKRFFEAVEEELAGRPEDPLPVIVHELNFEFTGCYTTQTLIKQANRFGENYLEEAETLAVLGERLGGLPVPQERLREAWINVLFNQFHDILPGSGVRQTREHAQALFQETGAITGAVKRDVGRMLAGRVDTLSLLPETPEGSDERALAAQGILQTAFSAGAGIDSGRSGLSVATSGGRRFRPYVVYNPSPWSRTERVTIDLYDTGFDPSKVVALDEMGTSSPTMLLRTLSGWPAWGHERIQLVFDARDVPPLGYRTYLFCEGEASPVASEPVRIGRRERFETPDLRLQVDREQSGLRSLVDKRTGASLVADPRRPLGAWQYVVERPRGMDAWVLGREVDAPITLQSSSFDYFGGLQDGSDGHVDAISAAGCRVTQTLRVPGTDSTVRVTTDIHALEPRIDVTAEVDWREIGSAERGIPGLVISFPLGLSDLHSRYETPFGSVERTLFDGEEVPTLRYAHVWGNADDGHGGRTPAGFTLLQDSKYGHSITGSELRLRIVRSSTDPDYAPEVAQTVVRYSLFFHEGEADPATLARLGAAWNHPLLVFNANLQHGEAPARQSFVRVTTPNVFLSALKPAQDGSGIVLRLVEMNGEDTEAVVEIDPSLTKGLGQAMLLDLMERPVGGHVNWDSGTLSVRLKAHSFATIRLA